MAGHLHAFNRADVLRLVNEAGLEPRGEMTDPLPYEHHAFFGGAAKGAVKWAVRAGLHKVGVAQRPLRCTTRCWLRAREAPTVDGRQRLVDRVGVSTGALGLELGEPLGRELAGVLLFDPL